MSTGATETFRLVADIGGSNARFALLRGASTVPEQADTLATKDFASFVDAVKHYLAARGVSSIQDAAIAIANPVNGDLIKMTNHHWSFSIEEARQQLRLQRLLLVNDFAALALSLPFLSGTDLRKIGGGTAEPRMPLGVVGPGTGLGVGGLIPFGRNSWQAIPGEGGHVTLAATNQREADVIAISREMYGHVSAERLISGMGLSNLHQALVRLDGKSAEVLTPAEVTAGALSATDAFCVEALSLFCAWLGNVAGNLALTLGARGGIYIGGGIVPRLGDYFERSEFRQRFEAKGRFVEYLSAIPTYVIQAENPALRGAVAALLADDGMAPESLNRA